MHLTKYYQDKGEYYCRLCKSPHIKQARLIELVIIDMWEQGYIKHSIFDSENKFSNQ